MRCARKLSDNLYLEKINSQCYLHVKYDDKLISYVLNEYKVMIYSTAFTDRPDIKKNWRTSRTDIYIPCHPDKLNSELNVPE